MITTVAELIAELSKYEGSTEVELYSGERVTVVEVAKGVVRLERDMEGGE